MKLFIIHDNVGVIKGTFISSSEAINMGIGLKNGLQLHVTDIPKMNTEQRRKYLLDVHRNHIVDLLAKEPVLAKRIQEIKPKSKTEKKV